MMPARWMDQESEVAPLLTDIMARTRALGFCVEEYFKKFGTRMPHGLTELSPDEFKAALNSLNVSWKNDHFKIRQIFTTLDRDPDREMRGTLGLDELACGVLDSVSKNISDFEIQYLEATYQILKKTNILPQVKDLMNFLNFRRDYSCRSDQFIEVYRNNFKIPEYVLEDWQIKIIMQKYAFIDFSYSNEGESKDNQEKVTRYSFF